MTETLPLFINNNKIKVFNKEERHEFKELLRSLMSEEDSIKINGVDVYELYSGGEFTFLCDHCLRSEYEDNCYYHHISHQTHFCKNCAQRFKNQQFMFGSVSIRLYFIMLVLNRMIPGVYASLNIRKLIAIYLTPRRMEQRPLDQIYVYRRPSDLICNLCKIVIDGDAFYDWDESTSSSDENTDTYDSAEEDQKNELYYYGNRLDNYDLCRACAEDNASLIREKKLLRISFSNKFDYCGFGRCSDWSLFCQINNTQSYNTQSDNTKSCSVKLLININSKSKYKNKIALYKEDEDERSIIITPYSKDWIPMICKSAKYLREFLSTYNIIL